MNSGLVARFRSIKGAAAIWNISPASVRRGVDQNLIRTVTFGGRRLIPMDEIERISQEGFGTPRPRKAQRVNAEAV